MSNYAFPEVETVIAVNLPNTSISSSPSATSITSSFNTISGTDTQSRNVHNVSDKYVFPFFVPISITTNSSKGWDLPRHFHSQIDLDFTC